VNGRKLHWEIVSGASAEEIDVQEHQTGSGQAVCVACGTSATTKHVKKMAVAGKMKESLAAVVVQDQRSKLYLSPSTATLLNDDACIRKLNTLLNKTKLEPLNEYMNTADSTTIAGRGYGISQWRELFTPRQLLVLFTLVKHIRDLHAEMLKKGMDKDRALALTTYFAMAFDRFVSIFNKFARWFSQGQCTRPALGDRQALKMVYDFSEINCLARTQGCLPLALEREAFCIRELAKVNNPSIVTRGNAEKLFYDDETFDAIITDPPYYSSIYYADLSAFFYVWLKRIVGDLYPEQFALASPPKRREAVAQPSMHDGDTKKANDHYQDIMMRSFSEARRVLKPGAPFVCVYAHKTTTGWAILIRALIDAKFTVTEAWPVQTESPNRMNTNKAAALSDSIFVVARRREESRVGEYETDVKPELDQIARERVVTLWDGGKGIGGADLLMAAVGAGLRAYTKFESVQYANGESMSAEQYLREVEGVVLNVMLDEIFGLGDSSVGFVDPISRFYILWRFTYQELSIDAGEAYVFCNPQGIEIDDSTGPPPLLIEKIKGKFRVRTWEERGDNEKLGISADDYQASLIDTLHRLLWLIDNQPINVQTFLKKARPNIEQLKLVASALSAPILKHSGAKNISPTKELHSLEKLIANWQNLVEGSIFDQEAELKSKGQTVLPPSFVGSEP